MLEVIGQTTIPVEQDQALNERMYGDLQGLNKAETAKQYGEQQVAAGYYQRVIRYRDHFLPLADGLQQYVACRGRR